MSALEHLRAHPLGSFLDSYRHHGSPSESTFTGTKGHLKGKWKIPDSAYPQFFDHLHDYLFMKKYRALNLVEQARPANQPKPILIDLDFKWSEEFTLTRRYTDAHIRAFIEMVVEGLDTFFDLNRYQELRFFVSLRPQPYNEKRLIKDGIHIQCPDITLTNEKQKVLRAWLLEKHAIRECFDGIENKNDEDDVYDEAMLRKQAWFFYGESKVDLPPYSLRSVYSYSPDTQELSLDTHTYTPRDLMEILSVRYNVDDDDNEVREEQKEEFQRYLRGPSGLGSGGAAAVPATQPTAAPTATGGGAVETRAAEEIGAVIPGEHDNEELSMARAITLRCLSTDRADSYKTWMEVGWCLYNIDSSEEMFDIWQEFSNKSAKSSENNVAELRRMWTRGFSRNTAGSRLTLRSLHYWARQDNPEEYKRIIDEDQIRYIQYKVEDTHFHIAQLLKRMYNERFCASVEQRRTEWYVFDESLNSWRHTNQGMELREKLSSEVADLIIQARNRLKKKGWDDHCRQNGAAAGGVAPVIDEDWYKRWAMTTDGERFQVLTKLEKHLYQSDFKSSVMKEAAELFCEEDFLNKLNMNTLAFVCKNGVLDLRTEVTDHLTGQTHTKVVFRPGKPDDWMSFVGGRNYPESDPLEYIPYDPDDPKQKELADFMAKLFPRADLRAYVLRLLASCLEGMNREQCYYTFIGVGGNGKSKIVELMRLTFGDYCSSLQATALTRKRPDSGAANPDIIAIKNKRFIYLQEPDDKEPLNTSRMKQFSGEDVVEARGLFEDQQRFRITGKLIMMCNSLPPITTMDKGTWRRIRVVPFESKFVDPNDPDLLAGRPGFFPRDYELDKKLMGWREAFLSLLVHIYEKEYSVTGLEPVPAIVMNESEKYKENFDAFGKFKNDRVRKEVGRSVEFKDLWRAYSIWAKEVADTIPGKRLNQNELRKRLEDEFGSPEGGKRFRHILVFDNDEDAEAFDRGEWVE